MSKKLFLKLGLLILSLSLVACGQKTNSSEGDNSSKSNTNQVVNSSESVKPKDSSVEKAVENKQEDKNVQQDTKKNTKQDIKQDAHKETNKETEKDTEKDTKKDTKKEVTEKDYYDLIKEAWQKQKDYINSIDDPKEKQSVQTAHSAAIFKSNELLTEHPEDSEAINSSLKKVLAGE